MDTSVLSPVALIMVGALLFFSMLLTYILNREHAIRYSLQISAGVAIAYLIHLAGYSELLSYLALGVTISLAFYMK